MRLLLNSKRAHVHRVIGLGGLSVRLVFDNPTLPEQTPMAARKAARSLRRFGGRARERLRYLCHVHHVQRHDRNNP